MSSGTNVAVRALALLAVIAHVAFLQAQPSVPLPQFWRPNGTVHAIAEVGNHVYLGGSFTQVGPFTGGGVPLDPSTGAVLQALRIEGRLYAVASDGAGGWYVGGNFTGIGGVSRPALARIRANGSVDPTFLPAPQASSFGGGLSIRAIVVGGGIVYVSGSFGMIGGQPQLSVAALDAVTGAVVVPLPGANFFVHALALDGQTLHVGGGFTQFGGLPRTGVASIDVPNGQVLPFAPLLAHSTSVHVYALALSGSELLIGGQFSHVNSQAASGLVAIDPSTGANAWTANANGVVQALSVSGALVYTGGSFTFAGGAPRQGLAVLDAATGAATPWSANFSVPQVFSVAVAGSTVYVGGIFGSVNGAARRGLAALDAQTAALLAFDARLDLGSVNCLDVSGGSVFAGGGFSSAGGVSRTNLAALDRTTGMPTSFAPVVSAPVRALDGAGSTLYAGGEFTSVDGTSRPHLAAFDASTGSLLPFNPAPEDSVLALVAAPEALYVGGAFTSIGGTITGTLAKLHRTSGAPQTWSPPVVGAVTCLALSDDAVYFGGDVGQVGGASRNRAAAVDRLVGTLLPWDPSPGVTLPLPATPHVNALSVAFGAVWVGGFFQSVGGQPRRHLAATDTVSGAALPPAPEPDNEVMAFSKTGTSLYVCGRFTAIGAAARFHVAQIDATGAVLPFQTTPINAPGALQTVGDQLHVGGSLPLVGTYSVFTIPTVAAVGEVALACASSFPGPLLTAGPPTLGSMLTLTLRQAPPSTAGGFFVALPGTSGQPLPGGCVIGFDPATLTLLAPLMTDGMGSWSLTVPLPADPALAGTTVVGAAALATGTGPFAGLDLTNVLDATFGY